MRWATTSLVSRFHILMPAEVADVIGVRVRGGWEIEREEREEGRREEEGTRRGGGGGGERENDSPAHIQYLVGLKLMSWTVAPTSYVCKIAPRSKSQILIS